MRKLLAKIIAFVMVAVAVIPGFTAVSFAAAPAIPDYTGNLATPHPITNKYELASIGSNQFGKTYPLDGNYIQTQDIVFTPEDFMEGGDFYNEGKGWKPIGNGNTSALQFSGKYDGGGFAIENIYINRPDEEYMAIFSRGTHVATLKNLGNKNGNIIGKGKVAGIAGTGFFSIENCYNTGYVTAVGTISSDFACGIVGYSATKVTNCYNAGNINSVAGSTGISGSIGNKEDPISYCYNAGNVSSDGPAAGIVLSSGATTPAIKNCYNTGQIKGSNAGGIINSNVSKNGIINCFNTGTIIGKQNSGGIAATSQGNIEECFNFGEVYSNNIAGGISTGGTSSYYGTIRNSYNRGKISGIEAIGLGRYAKYQYCYNAGELIGQTKSGAYSTVNVSASYLTSSFYDSESSKVEEGYPGSQIGKLATSQMIGSVAFDNMEGLNSEQKYIINVNGYPQLKGFAESSNPVIKDASKKSTQVGEIENPEEPSEPGEDGSTANGEIIGTVKPAQIKAVVPTIITFEIDPSKTLDYEGAAGDDSFISPSFTMQNAGTVPLDFSIDSITAQNNMPGVVAENKYTSENWQALSRGDTNGNIAFGFIMDDKTQWASAVNENNWYGNLKYPFGTINSNGQAQLHLKGKYGLNWGNALAKKITYDVVYKVEVVE